MKKSLFLLIVLFVLFTRTCIITFAEGNNDAGTSQTKVGSSASGQTTNASTGDGNGLGIDIHPIDANQAAQGFVKAGKDFGTIASGASVPLAVYGIGAALLLLFLGIFNKKFLAMSVGMIFVVIVVVVVTGDFMASVHFFYNLGATIRGYWS